MIPSLIVALGLTFFPGQPHWYELDTRGVEWTLNILETCHVSRDGYCLLGSDEQAAYDERADQK